MHTLSVPKPRLSYCMKLCTRALAKMAEYPTLQNPGIASDHKTLTGGPGRASLERGGGYPPPPPQHSGPDSTRKAFPYPNTSPNRISNRQ